MSRVLWLPILGLAGLLATASSALAQSKPYIGFVYPAGGQRGTTVQVRLGGQRLDGVKGAIVSGPGVQAKLVKYYRSLSNQELRLLRDQLKELKVGLRGTKGGKGKVGKGRAGKGKFAKGKGGKKKKLLQKGILEKGDKEEDGMEMGGMGMAGKGTRQSKQKLAKQNKAKQALIERIEKRIANYVNRPACRSLSSIALVKVTIAPDAKPGSREIRLVTSKGVSNPLVFHVGQVPEVARKAMKTCTFQVLGKEGLAQRKRPEEEEEETVTVPCTMNGQIASGEVNRYRFQARKGQRLVVSTAARQLIPYIADAVPGWFQPVLAISDADGKEVAFNDDFRFKPDPVILFEVPEDGEYVLAITDAIYRGREDFVYRVTIGQMPFVTSIFPLGARVGDRVKIERKGWNLGKTWLVPPPKNAKSGVHLVAARGRGFVSNYVPFALDTLPEAFDEESNNDQAHAQKVEMPVIVNGRTDQPGDWDVFQVEGRAGDKIVAEVTARRLDSPMDSVLKITDAAGKLLALNDDHGDPGSGLNTHHADSYLMVELPADGKYFVHLGDMARNGGSEYAYRLRISNPLPDFALRVVPSSGGLRSKGSAAPTIHVIRKDGFSGVVKLQLKDPPEGFMSRGGWLAENKSVTRMAVKTDLKSTPQPVDLVIEGSAKIGGRQISHEAVPAEDMMQAFLWRHLVPAEDLKLLVYNPGYKPPPKRVHEPSPADAKEAAAALKPGAGKPKFKFTKRQVAGRLRQLKALYEEWLLTDRFYGRKVAECEAAF